MLSLESDPGTQGVLQGSVWGLSAQDQIQRCQAPGRALLWDGRQSRESSSWLRLMGTHPAVVPIGLVINGLTEDV